MPKENKKMQVDIDNLFKQNVIDLSSIKELYRKLKEVEEKITQIKYIDSNLVNKLKKEYGNLKKIILDENIQAKLTDDIESINSQLDTVENRRIFSPIFYGILNWSTSYPVTNNKYLKVDETLNSWLNCCDGIILDLQILPNGDISDNTTYKLNPSIDWINYVIDKCKELNINIKGVKFHANEIRDNASKLTFSNWFTKYKNIINQVVEILKCEYILLFNESPSLLNRTPTEVLTINNYIDHLKNLGFKVGFGGVGLPSYLTTLNYNFDVISYHAYPVISGKMQKTTFEDSLIAWNENATIRNLLNARVNYPNKK